MISLAGLGLLLFLGCSTFPANAIRELKDDPNSFDLDVQTLYGRGHMTRIGAVPGATVTKSSDGSISITYPPNFQGAPANRVSPTK